MYIYSGLNRFNATKSITMGNAQAVKNMVYNVSIDEGILVIAYPDKFTGSKLEFSFWVDADVTVPPSDLTLILELTVMSLGGIIVISFLAYGGNKVYKLFKDHMALLRERKRLRLQQSSKLNQIEPDEDIETPNDWDNDAETIAAFYELETRPTLLDQPTVRALYADIETEYEIRQKMGRGMYGEIFCCIHRNSHLRRQVEIIRKGRMQEKD